MGFTDDCYTDGRVPSVSPSILFLPTYFIAVTDGMNPSLKLDNIVGNIIKKKKVKIPWTPTKVLTTSLHLIYHIF